MVRTKKKTSLLGVRVTDNLIEKLDIVANQLEITRSALVNMILWEYLNQKLHEDNNSPSSPSPQESEL